MRACSSADGVVVASVRRRSSASAAGIASGDRLLAINGQPLRDAIDFQFHAGDLKFKSSSYDFGSLVVAGMKALYKGSGTINGAGDYAFRVWAIDGKDASQPDRFRIKIWNKTGGTVVYDNQTGGADDADPTTELGGGNITIHK